MIYTAPKDVISPQNMISNVKVLFDGGDKSISLAEITWNGTKCIGIRWNVSHIEWTDKEKLAGNKTCVGMPTSHGIPVWFILPTDDPDMMKKICEVIKANAKN